MKMKDRACALSSTARLIRTIRNEIKCFNSPVNELFEKALAGQNGVCGKIVKSIIDYESTLPYPEALERTKKEFEGKTPFSDEEYSMLFGFFGETGTLYGDEMIKLCDYCAERFGRRADEARDEAVKKGRLYVSLFSLLGLAAAIILF